MSTSSCCQAAKQTSWLGKLMGLVSWILPGAILLLMPKCPACLAAYLAVATGLGVTISMAGYLQIGLVALCTLALGLLVVRTLVRWFQTEEQG